MEKKNDGGQAFPVPAIQFQDGTWNKALSGMSLRDYFAGQVMVGLLASTAGDESFIEAGEAADRCYEFADALIACRRRG